jgi:NAD-dependent SIR2 family protein deacetylase
VAGVSSKKIVYAHGSLRWARCLRCSKKVACDEILPAIATGSVPRCKVPIRRKPSNNSISSSMSPTTGRVSASPRTPSQRNKKRPFGDTTTTSSSTTSSSRRTLFNEETDCSNNGNTADIANDNNTKSNKEENDNDDSHDHSSYCDGVYKPGVTFFGEALDDSVRRALEADRGKVDALIVIGTSLSVAPISKVVGYLPPNIPRILINQTVVYPTTSSTNTSSTKTTTTTTIQRSSSTLKGGRHRGVVEAGLSNKPFHDGDSNEEIEFRHNYAFDAYLLGYCDDITQALSKKLFEGDNVINGPPNSPNVRHHDERTPVVKKCRIKPTTVTSTSTATTGSSSTARSGGCGGRMTNAKPGVATLCNVLSGKEPNWDAGGWSCVTIPPERVLLFPGALSTSGNNNDNHKSKIGSSSNNNEKHNNSSSTSSEGGVVGVQVDYREIAHCDGCSKRIQGIILKCVICFDYDLCGHCFPTWSKTHYEGKHTFCPEEAATE